MLYVSDTEERCSSPLSYARRPVIFNINPVINEVRSNYLRRVSRDALLAVDREPSDPGGYVRRGEGEGGRGGEGRLMVDPSQC